MALLFIFSPFIMPSEGHFGIRYIMDFFLPHFPLSHLLPFFFPVQIVFLYSRRPFTFGSIQHSASLFLNYFLIAPLTLIHEGNGGHTPMASPLAQPPPHHPFT